MHSVTSSVFYSAKRSQGQASFKGQGNHLPPSMSNVTVTLHRIYEMRVLVASFGNYNLSFKDSLKIPINPEMVRGRGKEALKE